MDEADRHEDSKAFNRRSSSRRRPGVAFSLSRVSARPELPPNLAADQPQGAATQEVSRNIQHAAAGTQQVSSNIAQVQHGASETGSASAQVHSAAKSLSSESNRLKLEVDKFLSSVRAA